MKIVFKQLLNFSYTIIIKLCRIYVQLPDLKKIFIKLIKWNNNILITFDDKLSLVNLIVDVICT
jgi:hypothetical protein